MSARLLLLPLALLSCVKGHTPVVIRTLVGETVILPCVIQHGKNDDIPSVEWSKEGLEPPNICFLYRDGCESFGDKNPLFVHRTSLIMEELERGNLSMRLSDVRLSDAGIYTCKRIQKEPRHTSTIKLSVGAVSEPKLSVVPGAAVTLQCEASCGLPRPEVAFLDAQGNEVGAEDPKSDGNATSGCVSVTRRATVQTHRVTCRVHQSQINQTRVTEIYIPDQCMSSCNPSTSAAVVLALLIPSAVIGFLSWKCYSSEEKRKLLPTHSSRRSSTCSNREVQNVTSQDDCVQNATAELRREVDELKSKLRDKHEAVRALTEELRGLKAKRSPVALPAFLAEGKHADGWRSVSDSLPHSNPKPHRRYTYSASNRFSVLADVPDDGLEPLVK